MKHCCVECTVRVLVKEAAAATLVGSFSLKYIFKLNVWLFALVIINAHSLETITLVQHLYSFEDFHKS